MGDFDEFIKSCYAKGWKSPQERDDYFYNKMEELFVSVEEWMAPYVQSGKVQVARYPSSILGGDEYYSAFSSLRITIGCEEAYITPISPPGRKQTGVARIKGSGSCHELILLPDGWYTHFTREISSNFRASRSSRLDERVFKETLKELL